MPMSLPVEGNGSKAVFFLIFVWVIVAWMSADYYFSHFARRLYQQESELAHQQVRNVASNIDESLLQLKGIPLVFARDSDTLKVLRSLETPPALPYKDRKKQWTEDKILAEIDKSLKIAAEHLAADVIWIINREGFCIAASNTGNEESFVGTNYADRDYFRQAKAGENGRQYAVGRASRIPGLFFSSPVIEQGVFLGAVVAKRNITSLAQWTNQADAFLSDTNGVIILAPEKELEFRAMPNAEAMKMPAEIMLAQYKQSTLTPITITPWGDERFPSTVRFENHGLPILLTSTTLAEDAIKIYVRRPLGELIRLSAERMWFFILVATLGSMLIYAASAMFFYLRKLRKTEVSLRVSATAFESQEGMMITDANGVIMQVNRAFSENTGFSSQDAVGQTPRLLESNRHDPAFFGAMRERILQTGSWSGEVWNRCKDGSVHPYWTTVTAVNGVGGKISHHVFALTDISQRKAAENEIEHLAFFDALTGLPNRRLLLNRLQQALANSARTKRNGALLFIDLDNFKSLNDTLGHDMGDLLLQQVAQRLALCMRECDTVARLGGDEFVVMLEDLSSELRETINLTAAVGEKILATMNRNFILEGHEHRSTPSIGITVFEGHQNTLEELLKRADLAMYEAKAAGRNTLRFFDPKMQSAVTERFGMEEDLRRGLAEQQFLLFYQAQVNPAGQVIGAEALVRWQHPERGLVPPDEFIGLAEETGLILPLGNWVLETACHQLTAWATQPTLAHLSLAVNVSAHQFRRVDFVLLVQEVLARTHANPHKLKLELTETVLLEDVEDVIAKMTILKALGVGFSLDDFGTGYSSLAYLKRLPLDQLKIDRTFVRDLVQGNSDAAICASTIDLARNLRFTVVAEGVESEAQRHFLCSVHGCDFMQGYLFSKPLPLAGFEALTRIVFSVNAAESVVKP